MPAVTIGVPVYNGDALLDECLQCLAAQTFQDFEVLVYDNASTDSTASIAQSWAARDARFRYYRQSENRGVTQNFTDVLDAATTGHFMWRAHDDVSASNFVEVTHRLLASHDRAKLAVGAVRKFAEDGSPKGESRVPNLQGGARLLRILRGLRGYHPSWFYGLWKREAALEAFNAVWRGNTDPWPWGVDHMALIPLAASDALVGSNETYFVQRKRKANAPPPDMPEDQLRARFKKKCERMLEQQPWNVVERTIVRAMMGIEIRRLFKPRKFRHWTPPEAVKVKR
jgi:glycosyltransferase involved in cell wall biosynthesis